ncbi:MAG: hypothetical protein ABR573_05685 [Candidatus Dormibacteria bacterium]
MARSLELSVGDLVDVRFNRIEVLAAPPNTVMHREEALLSLLRPALTRLVEVDR